MQEASVVKNHIEQRLMNPDATVVFNKSELTKAVHEETNAGSGGADHFCESFLGDLRNQCFRFTRLAKLRQQQQNPRQTFLAGVEKLIDKISLGSHAADQQKSQEQIREGRLIVHHADHLPPLDFQCLTSGYGGGSCHVLPTQGRQRLLSNEGARSEQRDGGLFSVWRNNCQFCADTLKIEEAVGRITLREEGLLWSQLEDSSPQ